jgi:hypothetical protein
MIEKTKTKSAKSCRGYKYTMKSYKNIDPKCIKIKNVKKEIIATLLEARENELGPRYKNLKAGEELEITIVSCLGDQLYNIEFFTTQGKICRALAHYLDRKTPQEKNKRAPIKKLKASGGE